MRLAWVELRDFRNHTHTHLRDIPEGLIVAVGPNGEGKTNLMEAMYLLYWTGSPRSGSSEPLVRHGADAGYVRGEFHTRDARILVETEIRRKGANRVIVNRSALRRRRDLRKQVRAVLFGPFDVPVVTGDPSRRRAFLDDVVVGLHPSLDTLTTSYERVLRQRNRLLKEWEGAKEPPGLEAWDEQLIRTGTAVTAARAEAAERIAPHASEGFEHLAEYGLQVSYEPSVQGEEIEESFRLRLKERRVDELQRRTSLVGPHRDDMSLAVRDMGARAFGSHGETWAAALCLRLAQAAVIEEATGEPPLLLVDDPYSALDPARRDRLAERLASRAGQVVISVADDADVPARCSAVWDVAGGRVTPRGRR
jgi:DNA replication and repair protein RecF